RGIDLRQGGARYGPELILRGREAVTGTLQVRVVHQCLTHQMIERIGPEQPVPVARNPLSICEARRAVRLRQRTRISSRRWLGPHEIRTHGAAGGQRTRRARNDDLSPWGRRRPYRLDCRCMPAAACRHAVATMPIAPEAERD